MKKLALATSLTDLPNDDDMPLLLAACHALDLDTTVCAWDDPSIDWSRYAYVVLRSTWDYTERRDAFLAWCERVAAVTSLVNPLSVARWATDKHYLADLAARGVAVVPSRFVEPGESAAEMLQAFVRAHPEMDEFVVKPTIGSYSKNVKRYAKALMPEAVDHIERLLGEGSSVILQPYLASVDRRGETDMVFYNHEYSHAIRKGALLMQDGTVNGPTPEFRSSRVADDDEQAVALEILDATVACLGLDRPLLYARVDLIRDDNGKPMLLELDICEPSLSLPFAEHGAVRFARTLDALLKS